MQQYIIQHTKRNAIDELIALTDARCKASKVKLHWGICNSTSARRNNKRAWSLSLQYPTRFITQHKINEKLMYGFHNNGVRLLNFSRHSGIRYFKSRRIKRCYK